MLSALIINGRRIPEATRESARMLFVDSKAPIRASARRDQWTDRSIDRSNALYMYTQVRYVFGQSGRREVAEGEGGRRRCTTPSVSCWHSDPVTRTRYGSQQRILAPTHADTRTRTAAAAAAAASPLPPAMYIRCARIGRHRYRSNTKDSEAARTHAPPRAPPRRLLRAMSPYEIIRGFRAFDAPMHDERGTVSRS